MKVFVYWNLHKATWSIKALEGPQKGRVVQHSKYVCLTNARGKVSEAGRQRVFREGRKNVHAGIVGEWSPFTFAHGIPPRKVTYNPYKYTSFVYADDETPYEGSATAVLYCKAVYAA